MKEHFINNTAHTEYSPTSAYTSYHDLDTVPLINSSRLSSVALWPHFIKSSDYKRDKKAACKHCSMIILCTNSSSSGLWRHLRRWHSTLLQGYEGETNSTARKEIFS